MIHSILTEAVRGAAQKAGIRGNPHVTLEHPTDPAYGDFSTNIAMVCATKEGENPRELAEKISGELASNKPIAIEKIEVAGAGFINFYLSRTFFSENVIQILEQKEKWGSNNTRDGQKIMVEYTDPNPFKEFHIGHLMPNVIGESLTRILLFSGAEVKRANYQGDIGLHVAKAIWHLVTSGEDLKEVESQSGAEKARVLGEAYTKGAKAYEENTENKKAIDELNEKIYKKSDENINAWYEAGRKWSLEHFEIVYKTLGTLFDYYFFESQVADEGARLVKEFSQKGLFEESEGALIFRGEKYGLHTRVFLTSAELPPYEAKDLALAKLKHDAYPYDLSLIITAVEQSGYYSVVKKALSFIYPDLAEKTEHIGHGMLRFASGKMSSRAGNVISGESLVKSSINLAESKIQLEDAVSEEERTAIAEKVGVGALKYAILKQATGKNIIYDAEKSFSFEGDSGPYLQYAYVRTRSILKKGKKGEGGGPQQIPTDVVTAVERLLYQFPEVVLRALSFYEPHYITTYLTELAGAFNSYYATHKVLGERDKTPYRLALTEAVSITLKNGLNLLGIQVPDRM